MPHASHPHSLCMAYFITPHGFGHAARAASVMEALYAQNPSLEFHLFTSIPAWFFEDSLSVPFQVHEVDTDVGLVQASALTEDIPATLDRLDGFMPFHADLVDRLSRTVKRHHCRCIVCDIAPLGIVVAQRTGIPSILIENFTWDWIYQGYVETNKRLKPHIDYLETVFGQADIRIQTEPLCLPKPVDLKTGPASRKPRCSRQEIRKKLGLSDERKVVLITMGGIQEKYGFMGKLMPFDRVFFMVAGGSESLAIRDNIALIPHRSEFYHPDLVNAADALVGKAGYSTLAEVYHAGIPFGYVTRPQFPESDILSRFIQAHIPCLAIASETFHSGAWLPEIRGLLNTPRINRPVPNGADQMAAFILRNIKKRG